MKIALVTSGHETLGVEYLSSVLKRNGHIVKLFFDPQTFGGSLFLKIDVLKHKFDLWETIVSGVIDYQPDIVGFSCMTHNYLWSLKVAQGIKLVKDIPIIFGGIHPTSVPEQVLKNECIDMVAVGEGEISLCELLTNMENSNNTTNVRGIYFKANGRIYKNPPAPLVDDLNWLPYPDKQLFYNKMPLFKNEYAIMTSRGCPYSCSYCCNNVLKKIYKGQRLQRCRSVDNVIDELLHAKNNFNIREVYFIDEVFSFDLAWLEEFSEKYRSTINLPFKTYHHFKICTDKHIKLLKNAGCYLLSFGMQSVSEQIRKDVCFRSYSNKEALEKIRLCHDYNIKVSVDHIFGFPFEKEDSWSEAVEFYRDARPTIVYTYWLTYYPNTSIVEKGKEAGLLTDEDLSLLVEGRLSYYHKGHSIKDRKVQLIYQLLFDLIPLLPRNIHKFMTRNKWLLNIFPKGYIPHFILIFITDLLKMRGKISAYRIMLLFSKKNIP